ncbi:MAG: CPBP family intramembrane metalloprotease [Parcubacteria group bacterium]|nr:CPBP family intramembrane metalloprotease [Parcubacteria group bacterium]
MVHSDGAREASEFPHHGRPWGIFATTVFVFFIFTFSSIAYGITKAFLFDSALFAYEVGFMSDLAFMLTGIVLILFCMSLKKDISLREYASLYNPSGRTLLFWVCVTACIALGMFFFNLILIKDVRATYQEEMITASFIPSWIRFSQAVFIAPLIEEFFIRGFLLKGYLGIAPSQTRITIVVVVTSLIFTVAHTQYFYSVILLLEVYALGILFGIARIRTNSIVVPIVMHSVANLVFFFQRYIYFLIF